MKTQVLVENERSPRPSANFRERCADQAKPAAWDVKARIVIFLIAIALPLTAMLLGIDATFVLEENRVLSTRPALPSSLPALAAFPPKFETYFNDQFGFRRRLILWQNLIKVAVLGVSPSPKVVLGRNDWLFYGDIELDYYRNIKPFTPRQLEKWRTLLEHRREWLAARGISYLVVIPPNKSSIYPEHMPPVFNKVHTQPRLDQLLAHLNLHSSVTILDLRGPLLAAKALDRVYYRTDTHWNNRGAYVAYTKIIEALQARYPDMTVAPRSNFPEVDFKEPGRDLSLIMAMRDYFKDNFRDMQITKPKLASQVHERPKPGDPPPPLWRNGENFVFEQPNQKLPRAVMFRDSFCTWLMPLLSDHFRRIVYCWQYIFDYDLVEREKPDVVIQEFVERVLMDNPLPYQ